MPSAATPLPELWFGPPPVLLADENWIAHHAANRAQGKRAVGGGLHFTTHRVLFCPNVIDARLGGKAWSCTLASIASVSLEPGRLSLFELFSGGLRERLRIDLHDKSRELFVIRAPDARAADLRTLLGPDAQTAASPLPVMRVVEERKP